MTEHILRALGGTDEKYILAYAEKMKEKNPKKIVLRRWLSAAAVFVVLIGVVLALPPVRHTLFSKNNDLGFVKQFDSFDEMMSAARMKEGNSAGAQFAYGTRLSLLDFDPSENPEYYICWENDEKSSLAMIVGLTYVCDFVKNGVRYEIANLESYNFNSLEIPAHFRNEKKYARTFSAGGTVVSFEIFKDRIECEFTDDTGYYKIICHSGELDDLYVVLGELLQYNFETGEAYP